MPDGLSEQQAIATEIPYKNIKVNTDAVDGFINAWSMATQLKLKRQEVEGKMAQLAERNRQLEINSDLQERKFGLQAMMDQAKIGHMGDMMELAYGKFGLEKTRADNALAAQNDRIEIERDRLGNQTDALEFRKEVDQRRVNAQGSLAEVENQALQKGLVRGTRPYLDYIQTNAQPYLRDLPANEANAWHRTLYNNSNQDSNRELQQLKIRQEMLQRDIGATLFGNAGISDFSFMAKPWEDLPDETKLEGTYGFRRAVPTGRKLITSVDPTGTRITKPVTMADITRARKNYEQVMKDQGEIAPQVEDPSQGIFRADKVPTTLQEKAQRALQDPAASPQAKAAAHKILGY